MRKRVMCAVLALAMLLGLAGCSTASDYLTGVKSESLATEAEIIDYYTQSMSYDTVASRTTEVNRVVYETSGVSDANQYQLIAAARTIESELLCEDWSYSMHVGKYQHQYMKYLLDDKVATFKGAGDVTTALGYYFVDLEYDLAPQACCGFTADSKYVGINGAYVNDFEGGIYLDSQWMAQANQKMLTYAMDNGITVGTQEIPSGDQETTRKSYHDVGLYNSVAGSSTTQAAFMPPIKMVIVPAAVGGSLCGYGMYPQGKFSLAEFGYDRSSMNGTMTLRYVFKQDLTEKNVIEFTNVYCTEYTLNNLIDGYGELIERKGDEATAGETEGSEGVGETEGIDPNQQEIEEAKLESAKNSILVPEFAQQEIKNIIERADRAISNGDLAALLNGDIFEDVGIGYLYGFYGNSAYGKRHMSNVEGYLARNGKKYLIDVESTIQESPIGTNQTGTYVQKTYMVVEQQGLEFKIVDYVVYDFLMTGEPQIDVDSNIMKQLAALGLQGEVPETAKEGIEQLLAKLYEASTNRYIDDMYACFDKDTSILPSKQYEYLNSQLRNWLTKMGANISSPYMGTIYQWIGGSDQQAEVLCEELIDYEGKDIAQYMKTYYLVSCYEDNWVIDDMQVLETEDINGTEADSIRNSRNWLTAEVGTSDTPKVPDIGELVLKEVIISTSVDGMTIDRLGTGQSGTGTNVSQPNQGSTGSGVGTTGSGGTEETGAGETQVTPVAPSSGGDANAQTNAGGQYVWSDKVGDWVWQEG